MDRVRRYPSDLTDAEWEIIEPMLPSPQWMGRPERHPRRAVVDGILYVVRTGCAWRYLPVDFPPWQTVYSHFQRLNRRGVTERILTELREQVRLAHDRAAEPTAGIIDSQSVRAADTVHSDTRGYDSGKRVNGRKRFIVTDTLGLLVTVWVLAASWQDRDGAKGALLATYVATPIRHVFADSGFSGRLVDWARDILRTTLEIVRKPPDQQGFVVHRRRWVVERTLAWLTAHRRLARDYETQPATSEAMIRWAAIAGMLARLTRGGPATRQQRRTLNTPD
ncbi:IS5 family transposase [Micromonospora sp. RL09-050-HVF-A]|uniref:IS5 family transposase n=1 Tax=Micromonospora sp. RL09-050-HVF-A TaxID=1703433 RepID=UPI001C5D29FF|nr:IS5 family transposase [Micromonospora sp. RL09-050-HVF-A]MBW4700440.1 IS5 family transposase [Micromonospora sp. RL09-050-HVF-A]MBW4700441.1 IS5 family transposase [Micromonospora sp. RL09-050-HVF-A]MBW4705147.1 IS5 family transposase [Micromonospora sp. RL09-050-HVF-A]